MKLLGLPFLIYALQVLSPTVALCAETAPKVCAANEHWVTAHFRRAYLKSDGTRVASANVSAHCQENPPSYAAWKEKLKSGMPPGWLTPNENPKPWTEDEKERVFEAIASLPVSLREIGLKGIYRMKESTEHSPNPGKGQSRTIALYDPAFDGKTNLSRILAHELAHEIFRQFSDDDREGYRLAGDWLKIPDRKAGKPQLVPNRDSASFVEEDGSESLDEDFSNNIEYFLFSRDRLKAKTRKVHDWIQNRFGDKFKIGK